MYVKMKGIFFKGSDWGRPLAGQINTECELPGVALQPLTVEARKQADVAKASSAGLCCRARSRARCHRRRRRLLPVTVTPRYKNPRQDYSWSGR
jgi:hypothetical protein